jgi:hypothetical protein
MLFSLHRSRILIPKPAGVACVMRVVVTSPVPLPTSRMISRPA